MGDTNGDTFIDYAIGAGLYDLTTSSGPCSSTCGEAGRIYIFTSNNTPPPSGGNQPNLAPVQNVRSLSLKTNKLLVAKNQEVQLSGELDAVAGGTACTANQTVAVERRRKRGGFKRIDTALTDSGGAFDVEIRVRRTSAFRATVGASSSCAAAKSAKVKVRVRK